MVATADLGDAQLDLTVDLGRFDAGLRSAEKRVRQVGDRMKSLGLKLSLAITAPLTFAGKRALDAASSVEEMRNLAAVTFGKSIADVEAWAAAFAKATGRSRFEILGFASDFAAFLKPLGVAPQAVAPMSEALAQLAIDISSLRNISVEEATTKLISGLAGETEAVRRLGVDLGQTALKAQLAAMGFRGNASEATQAQKVLARFALIVRQTRDAQGDAARTAASYENTQRSLRAATSDLAVAIGNELVPVVKPLIASVRDAIRRFLALDDSTRRAAIGAGLIAAAIGPAVLGLGLLTRGISFALGGFRVFALGIVKASLAIVKASRAALLGLVRLVGFVASVPGAIAVGIGLAIGAVITFRNTLARVFSAATFRAIGDALGVAFNNFIVRPISLGINAILRLLNRGLALVGARLAGLADLLRSVGLDAAGAMVDGAAAALQRGVPLIDTEIRKLSDDSRAAFAGIGDQARQDISDAVDAVTGAVRAAKERIKSILPSGLSGVIIGGDGEGGGNAFAGILESLQNLGKEASRTAGETRDTFADAMQSIADSARQSLAQAIVQFRGFGSVAKSILQQVLSAIIQTTVLKPLFGALGLGGIPGLAHGGPVTAGRPFIVGERGPELFVPSRSGRIVPNDALRASNSGARIEQRFSFGLVMPAQLEAAVRNIAAPAGRDAALQALQAAGGRL